MNNTVLIKRYNDLPIIRKEILRYAGCKSESSDITELLDSCLSEVRDSLQCSVCFRQMPIDVLGDVCNLGLFNIKSKDLAKNLKGCESVVAFAATIGIEIDRLISKYSRLSPSKALMFQAIGAQQIEALCDAFCKDISEQTGLSHKPRFSPGYGDLPLEAQKDIFRLLNCNKWIGLTLNDSLLMSPTKSVTAFIGLYKN